jgi:hypothetical protein
METATTTTLESLLAGHEVSEPRVVSLQLAIELGADKATLERIRDAAKVNRRDFMVLPAHRFENLSRGRGWARKGRGDNVAWGERCDGGYRVGPGRWSVGATDGYSRKASVEWQVEQIVVGAETWTIAN